VAKLYGTGAKIAITLNSHLQFSCAVPTTLHIFSAVQTISLVNRQRACKVGALQTNEILNHNLTVLRFERFFMVLQVI